MKKRIVVPLFLINFIVYFIGTGLMPILPLYASRFGISSSGSGLYIAFIFGAITLGTVLTGRIAYRYSTRGIFLVAGILGIPTLALLGRSTDFWQVVLLTAAVWFLAGVGTALVNVQAGLHTARDKRGQSFSLMFLALPAASLVAGVTVGRLVEWASYRLLFDVLAIIWAAWPFLTLLLPNERPEQGPSEIIEKKDLERPAFSGLFYLLLVATILSATTFYLARLGTSFSLASLGFSPSAVASTSAVGGLVALPALYLITILSNRHGRKQILILGYAFAVAATITMSVAGELWHFWLATAMLYMARSINGSVAPALATDLLTRDNLGRGLPYLSAGNWLAGIFGSAIAGIGIDNLGQMNLFLMAGGLAAFAALLMGLYPISRRATAMASI